MEKNLGKLYNMVLKYLDAEPVVYIVHVIDDRSELQKEERQKEGGLSNCVATHSGSPSTEMLSDCTSSRVVETN